MVSVRPEMKYLMSTFLPSFPQVCARPKPCLANCEVDFEACHVTVVSLAQPNFGHIYRVVSSAADFLPVSSNFLSSAPSTEATTSSRLRRASTSPTTKGSSIPPSCKSLLRNSSGWGSDTCSSAA